MTHHLLDLTHVPCGCANHGLESLHKALAEEPDEPLIWRPHHNPWLADPIEAFTADGQAALLEAQNALLGSLGLAPQAALLRKADAWTPEQINATKDQLQKPIARYSPDDWLSLVDLIVQTRIAGLPQKAAWLAGKSALAGRLQAISEAGLGIAPQAAMLTLIKKPAVLPPGGHGKKNLWGWAKARIALHVTNLVNATRAKLGHSILDHFEEHGMAAPGKLQQRLLDDFGDLNHDWRRIAITEAGETANLSYLHQFKDGAKIKRLEAYDGACPFCRKINEQVFIWSTKPLGAEHGWTHVWPGKTNVGRSASPRKQTPDGLVARTDDELWWPAAGLQHPNCRGTWIALPDEKAPPKVDQEFYDWMRDELDSI